MMSLCFYYNTFSQKINYLDYHGILIAPFIPDKPQHNGNNNESINSNLEIS